MNKIVCSLVVFILTTMSFSVSAQEASKRIEIGVFSNNASVSSNPVTGFSASGRTGFSAKFIVSNIPNLDKNIEAVIGASFQTTKLGLTGTDLGNVDSNTFMGGVRYRFSDEKIQPYVGLGVHFTSLEGSLANNTIRVNQPGSGYGTYLEAGVRGIFPKNDFLDHWSVGVQQFSKTPFILETSVGSAKISDVSTGSTRFGISIGKSF